MKRLNLENKAIFLDRDGVINRRVDRYIKTPEEFELLPNVAKSLKLLSENNFKLIIITNQSMVGSGLSTKENLDSIHKKMQDDFKNYGFQIDKIYCCTHKPDDNCECRKPSPKLFHEAINEFNIDIKNSWLIGDEETDIVAGKQIGCKTIKIQTNSTIQDAVEKILGYQQNL